MFLLLTFCQCSQRKFTITTYMPVAPLDSFGFEENGTFDITIGTRNRTTIIIFLATFQEMKARIINEIGFLDICQDPSIHLASLNSSFRRNTMIVSWRGVIKTKNTYYPYVLNCNRTKSQYTILTNFTNPESHLDNRDELYPYFYTILSYIYLFLTFVCLLNFLIYPSFGILIPPILAFITTSKSMIMSSYAQIWLDRRLGIVNYDYYGNVFFNIVYLFYYTSFFAFPTFIIAGWCIYRESIHLFESLIIIVSSLIFVIGIWSFRFTLSLKDMFVSIAFIMIGFLSMVRNIVDYVMITNNLEEIASQGYVQLRQKISLVLRFDAIFLSSLVLLALLFSMTVSFDFWQIVSDAIFEILLLVITVSEMFLFLYRREFAGDPNDRASRGANINQAESIENQNNNVHFFTLNEPDSACIAMIRN